MVNHKYKLVYIHIPKSAGSSIEMCILPDGKKKTFDADHDIMHGWDDQINRYLHHLTLEEVVHHFPHLTDYYFFTFVRNPWARCVSSFFYFRGDVDSSFIDDKNITIDSLISEFKHFLLNFSFEDDMSHSLSQHEFIINKKSSKQMNYIGKFESLQSDFNTVCTESGFPQMKIPYSNGTTHKHYTEYYDEEAKQIVADKYAKDIEHFGYKFEE